MHAVNPRSAIAAGASVHARHWDLDPAITFLNHGSFGACPRPVLEAQRRWRERLESEPVRFMVRELEPALDAARGALAAFVGARADDLVFVPNATTAVSTVLACLRLAPGDELLTKGLLRLEHRTRARAEGAVVQIGDRGVERPVVGERMRSRNG